MQPKPFGHARLADFTLDERVLHLNHGSFGATPREVLAQSDKWRARMEADPSTFFNRELGPQLRAAATAVAGLLGGRGEDWVFVENATAGMNAVIASVPLAPGDEVICLSQVYNAVGNVLRYHAQKSGARVVSLPMQIPFVEIEPLLQSLRDAISPRTKLAVFDHITSTGATVMPVRELAAVCRSFDVPVAIDGAHAPGMLGIDVPSIGADWFVGNLHKWAFAPRGTGVIWCARSKQPALRPVAISHYIGQGFTAEFDYSGTRDNSAWIATTAALDYMNALGVDRMRSHNHALARDAGELLAGAWKTDLAAAPQFLGSMATVKLPRDYGDGLGARELALHINKQHGITCAVMEIEGAKWLRVSAQVYNEIADYERLAAAVFQSSRKPPL